MYKYCSRDLVKASVEGGAAPAELEQHLYHRFHPPPVQLWEGVVVVIFWLVLELSRKQQIRR
jgi:hypothetical protein